MAKILYPELSYSIIDTCYKVYNELGYDLKEKYFHRAISLDLNRKKIDHERERSIIVYFQGKPIGEYFLDFVVDGKIIVEVKVHPYINLNKVPVGQVLNYLNSTGLDLAILVFFTRQGVKYKRIVNKKV